MDEIVILIPAFEPDEVRLPELVRQLRRTFRHLVLVDDGSTKGKAAFESVRAEVDAVLVHEVNRGKGAALKTGFAWIRAHLPDAKGVVTADADGQHAPTDIVRVAEATVGHPDGLVLGVRAFVGNVPLRSRFGNWWSRWLFRLLTGLPIQDTQTGLRGIPASLLPRMLEIPGDRYEYELRMLVDARRHPAPPRQLPIETIYINENASSHFRPFTDTVRTQLALWRAVFS